MRRVDAQDFVREPERYVDDVASTREVIEITDGGRGVARLVPVAHDDGAGDSRDVEDRDGRDEDGDSLDDAAPLDLDFGPPNVLDDLAPREP